MCNKKSCNNCLEYAEYTELGKTYGFESIENYETFKNRVPIVNYEGYCPDD